MIMIMNNLWLYEGTSPKRRKSGLLFKNSLFEVSLKNKRNLNFNQNLVSSFKVHKNWLKWVPQVLVEGTRQGGT